MALTIFVDRENSAHQRNQYYCSFEWVIENFKSSRLTVSNYYSITVEFFPKNSKISLKDSSLFSTRKILMKTLVFKVSDTEKRTQIW